jgi:mRNA interferase RelE/StbE
VSVRFRIDIPPHVAGVVRDLPPEVKRGVKEALRLLATDPEAGDALHRELTGYWRYRVRRYRVVYQRQRRVVRIIAVGHRRTIYEAVGEQRKRRG